LVAFLEDIFKTRKLNKQTREGQECGGLLSLNRPWGLDHEDDDDDDFHTVLQVSVYDPEPNRVPLLSCIVASGKYI
jgi:hypothetical protein